ncbi:hypothetical protein BKA56DRAFT_597358 [Ilyonectria sp. MPI-CAGE-AT-0026]|nr:hypothetical protein BKA56DRAFT_597358 [Ilyonectria sp. MPI-CAGE-AT-0026]
MGYSEVHCHICGVSFNISRIRTPSEPRTAAWSCTRLFAGTYVNSRHYTRSNCPPGCMVALRARRNPWGFGLRGYADRVEPTSAHDSATRDERPPGHEEMFPEQPDPLPADEIDRRFRGIGVTHELEHIAGPDCSYGPVAGGGYNGQNISLQEIRGCNTVQCLVRKPSGWEPEDDDQEFEKSGAFFLSGLSDYMPSRDGPGLSVFPERHSCTQPKAENIFWSESRRMEYALPFHTTCLEIFKQASVHQHGKIDIKALTGWWELEANETSFQHFPRDPAVLEARNKFWTHNPGAEYLVVNPCHVPGLDTLLTSARLRRDSCQSATTTETRRSSEDTIVVDPFSVLPQEVRTMILLQLEFEDMTNVQLSSRAFRDIPDTVFHNLIIRDWPWMWEAWSKLGYSIWASKSSEELEEAVESQRRQPESNHSDIPLVPDEERSNNGDASEAQRDDENSSKKLMPTAGFLQNPHATDWRKVRLDISRKLAGNQLKGLRNRQRIWKDCQEILARAEKYRSEGKL